MPLLVLVIAVLLAGAMAALAASRYPQRGGRVRAARPPRLAARLDPEAATGLALTLALVVLVLGGLVLAVLTFVLRDDPNAIGLDASAANWGDRESSGFTTDALEAITFIGEPTSVAVLAAIVAAIELARTRSRWVVPFMLLVVAGNGILTTSIKNLADRVRPELNPIAETLGPSFPSGHSSWSAAFFAAAALLLSRGRDRRARAAIAGLAAGCAFMIAGSRVLLSVHWLSDVIAGLALGAAWFSLCAIAFGGRLLQFGAPTEEAARVARGASPSFYN
jgi:membrane-associated phospholipid phosphatase